MKKLLLLLFTVSLGLTGRAQFETTIPGMRSLYQASYINPAFNPEYKLQIGLPVLSNLGIRTALTGINLHIAASSVDSGYFSLPLLYENMDGPIGMNYSLPPTDLFYLRFPIKGYYFGISNTLKIDGITNISREFIGFGSMGNDYFKGKSQDYELLKIKLNVYDETAISISKDYKRWGWGIRVKYLKGLANLETSNMRFVFNTDSVPNYPISLSTSGTIRTAGLPQLMDSDTINGLPADSTDMNYNFMDILTTRGNDGFGFDIGLTYQFSTKLSGWASVLDIGSSINWNVWALKYSLDPTLTRFGGLNFDQVNNKGDSRKQLSDSLSASFGKSHMTTESYKTVIPTRFYFGLDYDLSMRTRLSFMFQGFQTGGEFYSAYTGVVNQRLIRNWQMTGNFSIKNDLTGSHYDLGFGTSLGLGLVQFYFMADNLWSVIKPSTARDLYFRLGLQMSFGRVVKTKKLFL